MSFSSEVSDKQCDKLEGLSSGQALEKILEHCRALRKEGHISEREKGESFEKIVKIFLENEPKYKEIYAEVLFFKDWVKKYRPQESAKDTGIDLVAVKRDDSESFAAIQAKFYQEGRRIGKPDLDSFVSSSTLSYFKERYLVATSADFGDDAKALLQSLDEDDKAISLITIDDLKTSSIDWNAYLKDEEVRFVEKKKPREEQEEAIEKAYRHLENGTLEAPAKGRLVMACGTGKTFTSLKIAEKIVNEKGNAKKGGMVLFLAPSLQLISQTLTEWTQQTEKKIKAFAVCSDNKIGKESEDKGEDKIGYNARSELSYPATTDAKKLSEEIKKIRALPEGEAYMIVVFSTYHSSEIIGLAQHKEGLGAFDLVVCDEAHRTSGAHIKGTEKKSKEKGREEKEVKAFQYIHKTEEEQGIRRSRTIFMTATPRIFSPQALEKAKESDADITLYSMNDPLIYGEMIYEISFATAVKMGRLCPYKIIVLGVTASDIFSILGSFVGDNSNEVTLDVASRIIGAWKGISKKDLDGEEDLTPMKRAVAFCSTIDSSKKRVKNIASRVIETSFSDVIEEYRKNISEEGQEQEAGVACEVRHVDGTMNAAEKNERLNWLKNAPEDAENTCRILSNVRCLSEGVDVPALDAVIFLSANSSEVDVVQSVGRVMRTAPGKKRGYIIIPVVVPEDKTAEQYFLEASKSGKEHEFKTIWSVLQALRAHDESLDEEFDRINLARQANSKQLKTDLMEVVFPMSALNVKKAKSKSQKASENLNKHLRSGTEQEPSEKEELKKGSEQLILACQKQKEIADALYARIANKIGSPNPFGRWSKDVKTIVRRHIRAIEDILENNLEKIADPEKKQNYEKVRALFDRLKEEIHTTINENIPESEIIQMLGQHLVTGPVFDALFGAEKSSTPMTEALDEFTEQLYKVGLAKEQKGLEKFYDSVRARVKDATPQMQHSMTIQLYNDFFKEAFKEQTDKLGIVYTPLPIVDFILRSVDDILKREFGVGMGDEKVSILDPFTGTGSFIARLIELKNTDNSDYILPDSQLEAKYKAGKPALWANELVLLAYYVASVNIAASYTKRTNKKESFGGLCLTDTFNLTRNIDEKQKSFDTQNGFLKVNSERILAQENASIQVIIGNPPYSVGSKTAGEVQNEKYPVLDSRIEETYVYDSNATNKNSLYNSYIKALRWASDRVADEGVIGFVTGGGFLEGNAAAGI